MGLEMCGMEMSVVILEGIAMSASCSLVLAIMQPEEQESCNVCH